MLPTDQELMAAIRRISKMKRWNEAVRSKDAATLWQHEPLMAGVLAAACDCCARSPGTGPTFHQSREMAEALVIAFVQKRRCESVKNLVSYAAHPLKRALRKWTNLGRRGDPLDEERRGRRFLQLLGRSGLGHRATDSEISIATGTPREVVRERRDKWMLEHPKRGLCVALVRWSDGTVTAVSAKRNGKCRREDNEMAGGDEGLGADIS